MYLDTFIEYDAAAAETDRGAPEGIPPLVYYALALNGEAGEVAEKVKKIYRDKGAVEKEDLDAVTKELGDVLWYLSRLARQVRPGGLGSVALENIGKLMDRQDRGVIGGEGDDR